MNGESLGAEVSTCHASTVTSVLSVTVGLRDAPGAGAGMDLGSGATGDAVENHCGKRGARLGWENGSAGPQGSPGADRHLHRPPGPCTGLCCAQHELSSRRGETLVGPCRSRAAAESCCLVLAGSPRPTSSANAAGPPLGTGSSSTSTSSEQLCSLGSAYGWLAEPTVDSTSRSVGQGVTGMRTTGAPAFGTAAA